MIDLSPMINATKLNGSSINISLWPKSMFLMDKNVFFDGEGIAMLCWFCVLVNKIKRLMVECIV